MKIIAFNGFKRAGKGTAADLVENLLKIRGLAVPAVKQVGFADNVKLWAARSLGWLELDREAVIELMDDFKDEGTVESKAGPFRSSPWRRIAGREYLQNIGNEARDLFGDDFWIDQVLPPEHEAGLQWEPVYHPDTDVLLITDLRYPNEAERVKFLGGTVIEIVRPGVESDGHASEQELPRHLVDFTVVNDGSKPELAAKLSKLLS